jgi:hypothetical protein
MEKNVIQQKPLNAGVLKLFCITTKQWPLAPYSPELQITLANLARRVTFFSKMAFGKCLRVWRVRHDILANLANLTNF